MAIKIPIITELQDEGIKRAKREFDKFKGAVSQAEGALGKFKAGSKAVFDSVKANATTFATAAAAAVVTLAGKGIAAFKDLALEAGRFAGATGLSVEEASRLLEVTGDLGMEAGAVETALGKLNRTLDPKLFEELGIQIAYANDGSVDVNETFLNVIQRLRDIKDPAERAKVAAQVLGRGFQSMSQLVEMGSDKLRKKLDEVSDAKVISPEELEKARRFRDSMDDLKDSAEDLSIELGNTLIPMVTTLVDGFAKVAGFIQSVREFRGPKGEAKEFIDEVIAAQEAEKDAVDKVKETYKGYFDARLKAIDQNRFLIDSVEDAAEATYELNIQWQRLLDELDEEQQIRDAIEAVDDLKVAAAQAFADPSQVSDYKDAVADVIEEIARLAESIELNNADQNQLLVLVDTGQLERAVQLLAIIKKGKRLGTDISVPEAVQAVMENQAFLNTLPRRAMGGTVSPGRSYIVGERGPELLTMGGGFGSVSTTATSSSTINVYMPAGANGDDVVRALQQWSRSNGALPLATTTSIRR